MADVTEAAKALRDELRHIEGTQQLARAEEAAPELVRLVHGLAEAVDVIDPPTPILDA